jgi:ComF family protein
MIVKLEGMALDLLFPQSCIGCGRAGSYICSACRQSLVMMPSLVCHVCGRPQPAGSICNRCLNFRAEVDGIRASFIFEGVMRRAIHEFKYHNLRALAKPLAQLLQKYLSVNPLPGDILIPVPLHRSRQRERGYNQSNLLAVELGRLVGLPVANDCLVRHKHTHSQARTSGILERQSNVAGAFHCSDSKIKDKQVLLIDDVATSGSTLNACAAALKSEGAASVWGLTLTMEI